MLANSSQILFKTTVCICLITLGCQYIQPAYYGNSAESSGPSKVERNFRNDLVSYALTLVGSRYRSAGKSPTTGFDCSGLVGYVMGRFAIEMSGSSASMEKLGKTLRVHETQPGDLLYFRRTKSGRVFHVAIVASNKDGIITMVHSTSRGVVKDVLPESNYWSGMTISARDVVSGQRR